MDDKPRVGRSRYWLLFLIYMVATIVLLVGAVGMLMEGSWIAAIGLVLIVIPIGIWFRIVMMRRCRDIGWPPALPWISMGISMFAGFTSFGSINAGDPTTMFAATGFSWLAQIADFVLVMVLGAVKGRARVDYREVFGDGPVSRPSQAHSAGGDADDAIARALENYRRTGSAVPQQSAVPARKSRSAAPARPQPTGFGRKPV